MSDKHLIIIEDSDDDFDTIREALKDGKLSISFERARTGGGGLELIAKADFTKSILVILDLNTPGTNGRDALTHIKSSAALKSIPVIVLTTSTDPRDLTYCFAAGANAYHVKPVAYPEHKKLIVELLRYWTERVTLPQPGLAPRPV